MKIYSGRMDMWTSEETEIIDFFYLLLSEFDCESGVLTFEDRTKTGLHCKPHYHFIFKAPSNISHDRIRRFMSRNPELKGSRSSLKETDDYKLGLIYILKQYPIQKYVPFSDLTEDELSEYIKLSAEYNGKLKLNKWKDVLELIVENLLIQSSNQVQYITRLQIMELMAETSFKYDVNMPVNLRTSITYVERKVLPIKEFMRRFVLDNNHIIYEHDIKENASDTKIMKYYTGRLSKYFEDNDDSDEEHNVTAIYDIPSDSE